MLFPTAHPWPEGETLGEYLGKRGVSRRDFLTFCGEMTTILGLGSLATPRVATALAAVRRPAVIWLSLQECTGCPETILRTADPTIGNLILEVVSLDYQHNLMAAASPSQCADGFSAVLQPGPSAQRARVSDASSATHGAAVNNLLVNYT